MSQTHPHIEHIVIDGGSTDGTLEVIKADNRSEVIGNREEVRGSDHQSPITHHPLPITHHPLPITRVISEPDKGIYDALNKGIRMSTGDVVGFLHADDLYADESVIKKVVENMSQSNVESCYGDLLYVKETGNRENPSPLTPHPSRFTVIRYWKSGSYTAGNFLWGWMPPHPAFFVSRSAYEKYGLFNLDLGTAADYELMLRFLYKHRITTTYIPEVLVQMRIGGKSNASLMNRIRANQMDRKAWEVNGLKPHPWTLHLKPLRKISQYFLRN